MYCLTTKPRVLVSRIRRYGSTFGTSRNASRSCRSARAYFLNETPGFALMHTLTTTIPVGLLALTVRRKRAPPKDFSKVRLESSAASKALDPGGSDVENPWPMIAGVVQARCHWRARRQAIGAVAPYDFSSAQQGISTPDSVTQTSPCQNV